MSEINGVQKNRIRCEAKIRAPQFYTSKEISTNDGFSRRFINLNNRTHLSQQQQTSLDHPEYFNEKCGSSIDNQNSESTLASFKLVQSQIECSKLFNKQHNFDESWSKTQSQELEFLLFKDDYAKKSQCADFPEFQKTDCQSNINRYEVQFQESRILSSHYLQSSQRTPTQQYLKNKDFMQRASNDKNNQMVKILVSKNQEKAILEKKIFDLQLQLFTQKRNSDRALNYVALSLKNAEGACETQEIEIKRLEHQLKLTQMQRQKIQISHEARVQNLLQNIHNLENACLDLQKQIQISYISIQSVKEQNANLQRIIKQFKQQKQNIHRIQQLREKASVDFENNALLLEVQDERTDTQYDDMNRSNQQSIQSQTSYFQALIKQYEKQLVESKKKIKQQKKTISNLQMKVQNFERAVFCQEITSKMLSDVNDEIVSLKLKHLNSVFQFENI